LVIARGVGELLDAILRDGKPVADRKLLTNPAGQRVNVELDHR
jgi:hypothetical protein